MSQRTKWLVNVSDPTAKTILESTISEAQAAPLEFVRRDGRNRDIEFLVRNRNEAGVLFNDAGFDPTSLVEVAIGSNEPPTSGTFALSFSGNSTGLTALAYNISAAALHTALNANAAISAAGGVTVTKGTTDGNYIVTFNTDGARADIVGDAEALVPLSTIAVETIQTGDVDTPAIQTIEFKQSYLAYSADFAGAVSGSISVDVVQAGSSTQPSIQTVTITDNVTGGAWNLQISQAQVVEVNCQANTSDRLDQTGFIIYDATGSVGVWMNNSSATEPPDGLADANRLIEVTSFTSGDTAATIATAIATAVDADSKFAASATSGVVTITNSNAGNRSEPEQITPLLAVAQTVAGYTIAGSFPPDASAEDVQGVFGTYYTVTKASSFTWQLVAVNNGTNATATASSAGLSFATTFAGTLVLNTPNMAIAFNATTDDEIDSTLEIQVTEPGENSIKVLNIPCTIRRDVIDASAITNPSENPIIGNVVFRGDITAYTGGAASALDSIATNSMSVPRLYQFAHSTDGLRSYMLRAGTDAESSPAIIRPDDYAASTNEKVWQSVG